MEDSPKIIYHSDQPYPPVQSEGINRAWAAAMLDNQSGIHSEMSAVSLYFYDHLLTASIPEVAKVFHHISVVEMHHLEIFGTLALQMGETPQLWTQKGQRHVYWSPGYNYYTTNLRGILEQAITSEETAAKKYSQQTTWIQDYNVVENLNRIILDEQLHIHIFKELYRKYGCI